MKALDLCCGAGGWSLGAKRAGWTVEGIDLDMDAVATYQANVGPACQADVRQVRGMPRRGLFVGGSGTESAIDIVEGRISVVIGGVPCQPYSIAGKRDGEGSEDGRLWLEWLRIGVELEAEAIALENVRGFATWQEGRFIRHVVQTVESKGFHATWQVLDAADYSVPQHRDRIFLVAFRSPAARARFRWPEPTHGPPGHLWLPRYRTVRDATGIPIDEPANTVTTGGVEAGGGYEPFRSDSFMAKLSRAFEQMGMSHRRTLGLAECAPLQDFPLHFCFAGNKTSQYKQIGNAVPQSLGAAVCGAIGRALLDGRAAAALSA